MAKIAKKTKRCPSDLTDYEAQKRPDPEHIGYANTVPISVSRKVA